VEEALELLAANPAAHVLAGGQSLVPLLNFRLLHPSMLVDLNFIDALGGIRVGPDGATIGAMTRQADAEGHPELARHWPLLTRALAYVGHVQTRNRGTIGGSLAHNDPAAELPAVLLALEASIETRRRGAGRRIPASEFFVGAMATALQPGELLTAVHRRAGASAR
jgi:carbon-monoxide dehydrogenase medium subunit